MHLVPEAWYLPVILLFSIAEVLAQQYSSPERLPTPDSQTYGMESNMAADHWLQYSAASPAGPAPTPLDSDKIVAIKPGLIAPLWGAALRHKGSTAALARPPFPRTATPPHPEMSTSSPGGGPSIRNGCAAVHPHNEARGLESVDLNFSRNPLPSLCNQ